jgi:hypothetical protein
LPAQRQIVLRKFDFQAEIHRLPIGIGDRLHNIEREVLLHGEIRFTQYPIIRIVVRKRLADVVSRKRHHDVEVGRTIDRLSA